MKDASGHLAMGISPNQAFELTPNDLSKELEPLVGAPTVVTVRGQLYKKPQGTRKSKIDASVPLKLLVLEIQKKE